MNLLKFAPPDQMLGVMVDGREIKLAHLARQNGEISILALESVALQRRLGRLAVQKTVAAADGSAQDAFGFELPTPGDAGPDETAAGLEPLTPSAEGDVSSVLVNVFSKYLLQRIPLAINVPEGHATYYHFESDFALRGKKLTKRLRDEISPLVGGSLDLAVLDHFQAPSGALTAVVSEGNIPLIDELLELKSFLPNPPIFRLVASHEIALVNLIRLNLDLSQGEITALVYIGSESSRVIILRGDQPASFLQAIHEGFQAPQICQTIFSKILLEQEEAGIAEIHQIALTGEIGVPHAFEFFSKQFPEAKVHLLTPGVLNTQLLTAEQMAIFPTYAIPVALAWEALEKKDDRFLRTDLLPASIKDRQKRFKVAWHGFALLGAIFVVMVLLSYQGISRWNTIKSLHNSINHKQATLQSLQPELALIGQIQGQISQYRSNLEFLDSVIVDPGKWSRLFGKLTQDFHAVSNIWIENIQSDSAGFVLMGRTLSRDRVPDLADLLEHACLKRVTRVVSQDGETTYEYELTAGVPPPDISRTPNLKPPASDIVPTPGGPITGLAPSISTSASLRPRPIPAAQTPSAPAPQPSPQPSNSPPIKGGYEASSAQLYLQGLEALRAGDPAAGQQLFAHLLTNFPASPEVPSAHYWLGECHYAAGDYVASIADFQLCLSRLPAAGLDQNSSEGVPKLRDKREAALLMLGRAYLKLGKSDLAQSQFQILLQEFPEGEFAPKAKALLTGTDN